MARFTTRVQLNGDPTYDDYEKLHKAMKVRGLSRIISGSDDKHYWLPHAEYNRIAEVTKDQVLNDAKAAASTVSNDYEIVVTEGSRTWHGLKTATAAQAVAY
jgi:hypothetical protein